VCGNAVVPLIFKHLERLPRSVRFILTTRPGAGGVRGGVEGLHRRTFGEAGVTVAEVQQLLGPGWEDEPLLSTVIKQCELPVCEALYDAYRELFARQRESLCQAGRLGWESTRRLLSVLLAAREPLPHMLLQRLGLYNSQEHLPGWGVLFYEAEHHVHMLHKTLVD
jgi:hypothetical protein